MIALYAAAGRPRRSGLPGARARSSTSSGSTPGPRCSSCTQRSCGRSARSTSRGARSRCRRDVEESSACCSRDGSCRARGRDGELARGSPSDSTHRRTKETRSCARAQYVALMRGGRAVVRRAARAGGHRRRPTAVHRFFAALPPGCASEACHTSCSSRRATTCARAGVLEADEEFDVVSYLAGGPRPRQFCHVSPDGEAQ